MTHLRLISFKRTRIFSLVLTIICFHTHLRAQSPTSLSYPTPNVYIANVSSVYLSPSVAGNVASYNITPALPTGLTFNTSTGLISGNPTVASAVANYTITATGGSPVASTSTTVRIQITNNYFNNSYNNINFGGTGVTITNKVGNGTAVGNIVLYQNVATISGQQIDAIVKTSSLGSGSSLSTYDQTAASGSGYTNNEERFFSPQFNFASGGSATFDFQFILGGTYSNTTNTGTNIVLQNVQINTYDIDGNGQANSYQYNEFDGFYSSELGSGSTVVPTYNATTGATNFKSNTTVNSTTVITDPTRARVTYSNVSDLSILVGGLSTTYFFLDFGAGPAFATAVTTVAPTIDLNTSILGVNNSLTANGSSLAFSGSTQANLTAPGALNELTVSFPTAAILNTVSEQLLITGASSGGTIPLNFANAASITNVVLGGVTYKVVAAVSGGTSILTFSDNAGGTITVAQGEALLDAFKYNNVAASPTSGDRNFTVNVRNTIYKSPNAIFTASLNYVSIGGQLYRDNNGMTDNLVNASGTQFAANAVYVVSVNPSTNQVIDSKAVAEGGAYNFGTVTPGSYALYVSNSAPAIGSTFTTATYPAGGYVSTGENLGSGTGNDLLTDGKILVTIGSNSLPSVNMGIEIPPVTTTSSTANQSNPGGFNNFTIPNGTFGATDADGNITSITITEFPTGANYLKIGSVVYSNPSGGVCPPMSTCTTWPGTVTIPYNSGNPSQPISIDPAADVITSVAIKFTALDDAGIASNGSTLTIPFVVTSYYSITGSVWSDYNGDGIKDASEPFNATAANGQTLYVLLVQNSSTYSGVPNIFTSAAVNASTGYTLTGVPAGNNYELRLVSLVSAPVAGSAATDVNPNLAAGWTGVSITNGEVVTNHLNTNNLLITVNNLASGLTGASFGTQQTAIPDTKAYTNVDAGNGGSLSGVNIANTKTSSVTYVKSLSMSGTASSGNTPGILTGTDPDGGTGGTVLNIGSGTSGYTLVIDPARYTNTGSSSQAATMLIYNGVQLQAGGCQGSDGEMAFCSNYNSSTGFWEIPNYNSSLLKVLGTVATTQMGFYYAWKDASGATGVFNNYDVAFNFALPLKLISMNAENTSSNHVLIQWKTIDENATDHFDIERSTDGTTFAKIGTLKAGAQLNAATYSFTDISPAAGNNYYRLVMYDQDGSFKYSATALVATSKLENSISVVPNPVKNNTKVTISWKSGVFGAASVTIYEGTGKMVYKSMMDASGKITIPVSNWAPGVYHITLDNGKRREYSKLLVN